MRQVLQSLKTGKTTIENIPAPQPSSGQVLVRTTCTLISAGTERMLVEFGKSGWLGKIKQQPDKVRQVLNKMKVDGIAATLGAVQSKLDQPLALGYCNVGVVEAVGPMSPHLKPGDRVVSNGPHADSVLVSPQLCTRIPDTVSDEDAAFTVLGAIALQGIRLANPTLGERFVVMGLGLLGLLTVQLLKANGCQVLGVDFDPQKLALAQEMGAEIHQVTDEKALFSKAHSFTKGEGVDGVILTLSTQSNDPVHQAAEICRKRGRIVLVGVTGLKLSRDDFYKKELSFQVSCSYGPGRYESAYEDKNQDYPAGFVRWTSERNMEAFLEMVKEGRIQLNSLISHRFSANEAEKAYDLIIGTEPSLGILLQFEEGTARTFEKTLAVNTAATFSPEKAVLGVIGAGNYCTRVLLPAFQKHQAQLHTIASQGGLSSAHAAKKFDFHQASSQAQDVLDTSAINTVVIATRHASHASWVVKALTAGKHVFVEKPLAISLEQIETIEKAYTASRSLLMVGFNRRFSPFVVKAKSLLAQESTPKSLIMTVNAGWIPADHWTQDLESGGGRIIGEGCHFIDLLRHLAGAPIVDARITVLPHPGLGQGDTAQITLQFKDGSWGSIHYLGNGHNSYPKETLQVFVNGKVLVLDNFRSLQGYGWSTFKKMKAWRQDKGQDGCVSAFLTAIETGAPSPIPYDEILEVAKVTVALGETACA